jgi:hypothetical protein
VAQLGDHLPYKCEPLIQTPVPPKNQKNKKTKKPLTATFTQMVSVQTIIGRRKKRTISFCE